MPDEDWNLEANELEGERKAAQEIPCAHIFACKGFILVCEKCKTIWDIRHIPGRFQDPEPGRCASC